jgi:hypothetical protein
MADLMECQDLRCMSYGDSSLGRAAYICSNHVNQQYIEGSSGKHYKPEWEAPWEACRKVWTEWQKSAEGQQELAAMSAEQREIDFVNSIAGTLR